MQIRLAVRIAWVGPIHSQLHKEMCARTLGIRSLSPRSVRRDCRRGLYPSCALLPTAQRVVLSDRKNGPDWQLTQIGLKGSDLSRTLDRTKQGSLESLGKPFHP